MRALAIGLTVLTLSACASSYRAYDVSIGDGYSEIRLSENQWRVQYAGAGVDSPALVERRLLHRAAELTLQSGYDWFAPTAHDGGADSEIVVEAPAPQTHDAVWRPRWRQRSNSQWTDWDPRGAPPSPSAPAQTYVVERYTAAADISMGRAPMPAQGAFDARAVDVQEEQGHRP